MAASKTDDQTKTLRDELAMAAMIGMAAPYMGGARDRKRLAYLAYCWADEMLEARDMPAQVLAESVNRRL